MVVRHVRSGPNDFHRHGNKRQVRVVVAQPFAGVLCKTKMASFHPLLLQLVVLVAGSSSSRPETVRHHQRAYIALLEVSIWSLLVATGVEVEEAVRVNGRTNKSFVCFDYLGILTECYLVLLRSL